MGIVGLLLAGTIMFFLAFIGFKVYFKEQPQKAGVSSYSSVVSDTIAVSAINGNARAQLKIVDDIKFQLKTIDENDPLASEKN